MCLLAGGQRFPGKGRRQGQADRLDTGGDGAPSLTCAVPSLIVFLFMTFDCFVPQYTCMFISAGEPGNAKKIQASVAAARKVFRVFGVSLLCLARHASHSTAGIEL